MRSRWLRLEPQAASFWPSHFVDRSFLPPSNGSQGSGGTESIAHAPTISIVDDDDAFRRSLVRTVLSAGWRVEEYDSGSTFLDSGGAARSSCVLLDVRMPRLGGLAVQQRLLGEADAPPIVFISGFSDVPAAVEGIRKGAVHFLQKPFSEWEVLASIERAVARGDVDRRRRRSRRAAREKLEMLSARQRDVLELLMKGPLNKQIAAELGISERTVEVHRNACMKKLGVGSVVELVSFYLSTRDLEGSREPFFAH